MMLTDIQRIAAEALKKMWCQRSIKLHKDNATPVEATSQSINDTSLAPQRTNNKKRINHPKNLNNTNKRKQVPESSKKNTHKKQRATREKANGTVGAQLGAQSVLQQTTHIAPPSAPPTPKTPPLEPATPAPTPHASSATNTPAPPKAKRKPTKVLIPGNIRGREPIRNSVRGRLNHIQLARDHTPKPTIKRTITHETSLHTRQGRHTTDAK